MRFVRSFALVLALAFLILPAAPLGGAVPIPTVGGVALAGPVPFPDECHSPCSRWPSPKLRESCTIGP